MAVLETKIYSALSSISTPEAAAIAIYPLVMPQDPALPAVTYQRISSSPANSLAGYSQLENAHIVINSWGTRYDTVKDVSEQVHLTMNGATGFKALLVNDFDGYDPDTGLFVVSQDFSCWDRTS